MSLFSTRYITEDKELYADESDTLIKSTLSVRLLRKSDFGVYLCRKPIVYYENDKTSKWKNKTLIKQNVVISVFTLKEIHPKPTLLNLEVGNLIATEYFFWYNTAQDIQEVSVEYTVNNKDIDLIFSGSTCSFGTRILHWIKNKGASTSVFPYIGIGGIPNFTDSKRAIVYYCLFPQAFGIHRINFMRYVDIPGKRDGFYENVQHPYVFVVLPHSKLSFFRYFDDSMVYAELENLVQSAQPIELIEMKVDALIKLLSSNEEKVLFIANCVQCVIITCTVVIVPLLSKILSKLYFAYIIFKPARLLFFALPSVEQMLMIEGPVYDVFISHSDEERIFVTDQLVPFLEKYVGVNVCFSGSDELKPGLQVIRQFIDHITKSCKIIVVLSTDYHEDYHCERLQLELIILPLFYEEKRKKTDILFILYNDGARLPEILRWNFEAQHLGWNNHLPDRLKLETVRRWITTGDVSIS
ncbi:hypothetical protein DPMN_096786 [Dreissena polymorpha]|uniref:TIR domain-containing protein n=2 Tax=Dreissena polymorpha TaxID=45954 RepID=A0A9D4R4T5_DREPO|nr:hypothetical protein DPMN_096786 [Dreissena polymorpha]